MVTFRRSSVSREVMNRSGGVGENPGFWRTPVAEALHCLFLVRVPRFCPRVQPLHATLIGERSVVFDRRLYRSSEFDDDFHRGNASFSIPWRVSLFPVFFSLPFFSLPRIIEGPFAASSAAPIIESISSRYLSPPRGGNSNRKDCRGFCNEIILKSLIYLRIHARSTVANERLTKN